VGHRQQALLLGGGGFATAEGSLRLVGPGRGDDAFPGKLRQACGAGAQHRQVGLGPCQFGAELHRLGRADQRQRLPARHLLARDYQHLRDHARER